MVKIGAASWRKSEGVGDVVVDIFEELGCEVTRFLVGEPLPKNIDYLFCYGPEGPLWTLARQLLAIAPSQRPQLVMIHAEQFPNPNLPFALRRLGGWGRSSAEIILRKLSNNKLPDRIENAARRATRLRYFGDLYWLRSKGIEPHLIFPSAYTANLWHEQGFRTHPMFGFSFPRTPIWGADLNLERDIDVLWLGKAGSKRRADMLTDTRSELEANNISFYNVDGIENPYTFGEERTHLLNRTKIVLNLLREPWDENFGRFYLAALNRCLIVTEDMLPHNPYFVPGQNIISAPPAQLAKTIIHYLKQDEERERLTDQCLDLVTTELTLQKSVTKILAWLQSTPVTSSHTQTYVPA